MPALPVTDPSGALRLTAPDAPRQVYAVGLACCAVEVVEAALRGLPTSDLAGEGAVLLVAGTVTKAMSSAVAAVHAALVERHGSVALVAYGACATSGGPYWDSYAVHPVSAVASLGEVAGFVPGCPPRPETVAAGLREVLGG